MKSKIRQTSPGIHVDVGANEEEVRDDSKEKRQHQDFHIGGM